MIRICKKCSAEKPISEYREYAPGKFRLQCIDCQRAEQRVFSRNYARRKREEAKAERAAAKLSKTQVNTIAHWTPTHLAEFLSKFLDDREALKDLLS